MKNRFLRGWIAKVRIPLIQFFYVLMGVQAGVMYSLYFASSAFGSSEMDRKFGLESIGFLKPWDNVDGLFAEHVSVAYKEYFSNSSRFRLHDIAKVDELIEKTKLPYKKVIEDRDVLNQLTRSMRLDSLIRTKITKEGPRYKFKMEWLLSPNMEVIASHEFLYSEPPGGTRIGHGALKDELHSGLDGLVDKVPFFAHVTGRDERWVTVNVGSNLDVKRGDVFTVSTLEGVKKHPLLNAIVDWQFVNVGQLEVVEVDRGISFCRVLDERDNRKIVRFQKVTKIFKNPKGFERSAFGVTASHQDGSGKVTVEKVGSDQERGKIINEQPKEVSVGYATGNLWFGPFSRQYSNGTSGVNGGGLLIGAKLEGQIWLTKRLFAELGFSYGFFSHTQEAINTDTASDLCPTPAASGSGNSARWQGDLGYSYLASDAPFGPRAWVKVGYHSSSYGLPAVSDSCLSSVSFSAPFVGLGGDLPIRGRWGALLEIDLGLFTSVSEGDEGVNSGDKESATDINLLLALYYRFGEKTSVRFGLDVTSQSAEFSSSANITHRVISFGPALMYYF